MSRLGMGKGACTNTKKKKKKINKEKIKKQEKIKKLILKPQTTKIYLAVIV